MKIYKTHEHLEVAVTFENIAHLSSDLGDYKGAIEGFEKVLGKI